MAPSYLIVFRLLDPSLFFSFLKAYFYILAFLTNGCLFYKSVLFCYTLLLDFLFYNLYRYLLIDLSFCFYVLKRTVCLLCIIINNFFIIIWDSSSQSYKILHHYEQLFSIIQSSLLIGDNTKPFEQWILFSQMLNAEMMELHQSLYLIKGSLSIGSITTSPRIDLTALSLPPFVACTSHLFVTS